MLIIQDKLISTDVIKEQFLCNLKACKGACCWEGDMGAPLEAAEVEILETIVEKVKPYLLPEGIKAIEEQGAWVYFKDGDDAEEPGTTLIDNGACAYMTLNDKGVAQCGIEQAYNEDVIDFKKPISCHLYPIRVTEQPNFHALNYDRWDICSAACDLGKSQQLPVYKFLKEPLIRKYGEDFYNELELAVQNFEV